MTNCVEERSLTAATVNVSYLPVLMNFTTAIANAGFILQEFQCLPRSRPLSATINSSASKWNLHLPLLQNNPASPLVHGSVTSSSTGKELATSGAALGQL